MSYYNNKDDWNRGPTQEGDFSSGQGSSFDDRSRQFESGRSPPTYGYNQNQAGPGGAWSPQSQLPNSRNNAAKYNDMLERQGIPTVSSEDLQILQECGRESLYYRCVPFTAALCAGIVYASRVRQWKPRYYHYLSAVLVGYFGGKMSYRSVAEERLINSRSNSPFVNALRKRRGLYTNEVAQGNLPTDSFSTESDWTTPANKPYGIDEFDRDDKSFSQPLNSNRRDAFDNRDDFGSAYDGGQDGQPLLRPGTTYDDLRSRNRSSYKNV